MAEAAPVTAPAPAASPPATSNGQSSAVADAMASLMQAKGLSPIPSDAPSGGVGAQALAEMRGEVEPGTPPATPPAGDPPPPPADPAQPDPKKPPPPTAQQLYDRIASKDRLYQDERNARRTVEQRAQELEQKHNEFLTRFKQDPLAVMREHGVRFSDLAMQSLAGKDGKAQPKLGEPPQTSAELATLQKRLDEQDAFIQEMRTRDQEVQRAQSDQHAIGLVKDHLKGDEFTLVNEMGRHDEVLKRVRQHVGSHGGFADDNEAAEVLTFYAREVESEERRQFLGRAGSPAVKALLAKELGFQPGSSTQRDAPPARQENEGPVRTPNPRPALSNDLTTQRTTTGAPQAWDPDAAMRQTLAEINAIRQA